MIDSRDSTTHRHYGHWIDVNFGEWRCPASRLLFSIVKCGLISNILPIHEERNTIARVVPRQKRVGLTLLYGKVRPIFISRFSNRQFYRFYSGSLTSRVIFLMAPVNRVSLRPEPMSLATGV